MYDAHARARLLELSREIKELQAEFTELFVEFQKECDHDDVVQGEWTVDDRCVRMCTVCGLEEDGWYDEMDFAHGHTHLGNLHPSRVIHKIPRKELEKYRSPQPFTIVNYHSQDRVAEVMQKALVHAQNELQNYKHG